MNVRILQSYRPIVCSVYRMASRLLNATNWKFKLTCFILILLVCFGAYLHWFPSAPSPQLATITRSTMQELSQYTSEETLFFTTGKGDALKHEPRLLEYIRSHMWKPSGTKPILETWFKFTSDYSQIGQSKPIDRLLGGRRNGFFLECGAQDGEFISNTLFFELKRNWTGLLIEADPKAYKPLLKKNRNAYFLPACLSIATTPSVIQFNVAGAGGGIASEMADLGIDGGIEMIQCYPFNSVMDAIGVYHIDYFSLDVERAELGILNTIDFRKIRIDVISIEYSASTTALSLARHAAFVDFFNKTAQRYGRVYEIAFYLPLGSTPCAAQDLVFKLKN